MTKVIKRSFLPLFMAFVLLIPFWVQTAYADQAQRTGNSERPFASEPTAEELAQINALMQGKVIGDDGPMRSSADISFTFDFSLSETAYSTGNNLIAMKENDTSYYVKCTTLNRNFVNLYTDGYWNNRWNDCTNKTVARLSSTGEFQIYNYIWEWHRDQTGSATSVPARLGAWRANSLGYGNGYVVGKWSPDVILYSWYTVLNP